MALAEVGVGHGPWLTLPTRWDSILPWVMQACRDVIPGVFLLLAVVDAPPKVLVFATLRRNRLNLFSSRYSFGVPSHAPYSSAIESYEWWRIA